MKESESQSFAFVQKIGAENQSVQKLNWTGQMLWLANEFHKRRKEVERLKLIEANEDNPHLYGAESIHHWFGLSYASYLVLPRVSLQTMPAEWQEKFVTLLEEMSNTVETEPEGGNYFVYVRNNKGQFISDPFSQYRHKKAPIKPKQ